MFAPQSIDTMDRTMDRHHGVTPYRPESCAWATWLQRAVTRVSRQHPQPATRLPVGAGTHLSAARFFPSFQHMRSLSDERKFIL